MLFQELGLADAVQKAVEAEGYTTPTPIQEAAIPQIMAGRDLIGILPDRGPARPPRSRCRSSIG